MTRKGVETTLHMSMTSTCSLNVSKKTDFIDMFEECIDMHPHKRDPLCEQVAQIYFARAKRNATDTLVRYRPEPEESVMKRFLVSLVVALSASHLMAQNAADPADVDAVVTAVKAANPDLKSLCQKGPDGIRKASTDAVLALMSAGKLRGNPQAAGGTAGQRVGQDCRGG
jgi:hypothetical protein